MEEVKIADNANEDDFQAFFSDIPSVHGAAYDNGTNYTLKGDFGKVAYPTGRAGEQGTIWLAKVAAGTDGAGIAVICDKDGNVLGGPYATLEEAFAAASGIDGATTVKMIADYLMKDSETFTVNSDITLDGDGHRIIRDNTKSDLLTFSGGSGTVTVRNVEIDGSGMGQNSILVTNGASVTLDDGTTITNGGSGVWLGSGYQDTGSLTINDGVTISGHTGFSRVVNGGTYTTAGGVGVTGDTVFTMNGGKIEDNSSRFAGGIVFVFNNNGSAIINGGIITGNSSPSGAGGVLIDAGGKVTLAGGNIEGNSNGGVRLWDSSGQMVVGSDNPSNPLIIEGNHYGTDSLIICARELFGALSE